ncbi:hypothetical protein JR316_0002083 [Psilocybe cubensis]|uniref:Uncharacterized protein n=2 Tax=Psilocybe cubensis TaxID=181762 RepID=A0A8H7Y7Z2_PSICU|nr:hypothetical protein JR316_0002083 [Psilocybe cubensis]KAH9485176.1 hypothetical protein JR316_0002083 [Psilocybe cubensis]
MASKEQLNFNEPHAPKENAIEAFNLLLPTIKNEILKSRRHWDKHEPRMWARASGLSDAELTSFTIENDLVEVSSSATSYGTIVLGKIRVLTDDEGEGFVHVRIHDPPNRGSEDVIFHSLFTDEIREEVGGSPIGYQAIQTRDKPLEFFNE